MMGRTHALTGAAAGLAAAPLAGLDTLAHAAVFAVITAGWAIVPDLDHPSSSASRLLGPVTRLLSWLVRTGSGLIYRATKGPRDEQGVHRTVTHTGLFAVLVGVVLGWAGTLTAWVPVAAAVFGVLLAVDRLGGWLLGLVAGLLALWLGTGTTPAAMIAEIGELSAAVGVAAGLGCLVHTLGDMITLSGAPILFPIPIAGETYYEVRPPRALRFRTGGKVENWLVTPLCLLAIAAATASLLLPEVTGGVDVG
ncbi:membrane-bound metal-dependent hydrolase YbcI (DUF457 family) [Prauserella isguenensis]|uniref:Membrane-bound metal-dependent hydrolase YbcI (DUF457 family) n=1 Tax=Prauserella isguenensis TaxID=1470180 RepID=A0A839S7A7_9PSEU|nr:metal-dependent hydrolase [Prauserella isguenensis]MBB3053558.1 membrane-bound metal-dependent hydrolase YbcI (DUF457 family) [Prauserella isguenensis]